MTSQLFQNGSDSFISWFGLPNPNQEIGLSLDELPFQFILVESGLFVSQEELLVSESARPA
jgi:hypothetical protein